MSVPTRTALRINPFVRLFDLVSSIRFGITMLVLILIYASVVSAVPSVARALELSEMDAFRHWLFITLISLFMLSLSLVTFRRIRWNLMNAGVLTVHAGLLVLCSGSIWYFSHKHEGDVRLESPRIELVTLGTPEMRQVAKVLAEKGQTWSATMPAFGGRVRIDVLDTTAEGMQPAQRARVRVTVGDAEPREVELVLTEKPLEAVHDRLAVRLVGTPLKTVFYDDELPAIWARPTVSSQAKYVIMPVHGLPRHVERFPDDISLRDTSDRPVVSKRSKPQLDLLGLRIPTGWFENWTLPIRLDSAELPFDAKVIAYLPYVSRLEPMAVAGGETLNPAANMQMSFGKTSVNETLFALDPAAAVGRQTNIEYRWVNSLEEREALLAPLAGPDELTVELLNPPFKKTYAIAQGQTIKIDGTPYELTIVELVPNWPLMSPGFENARSSVARVDVKTGEKSYNRTVVQRFPQLTQDIDETGMRRKDGPYDPNLILHYRSANNGSALLVGGPGVPHQLGLFTGEGRVQRLDMEAGTPQSMGSGESQFTVVARDLIENADRGMVPVVVPPDARRPVMKREKSTICLELTGRGENSKWSQTVWILNSDAPEAQPEPAFVRVPGESRPWEILYARFPRDLGATLGLKKMWVESHPGQRAAAAWQSDVVYRQQGLTAVDEGFTRTNHTMTIGDWTYFQAGAATDNWSFTILGVGNREGVLPMFVGCIMIALGCLYAFYVKPMLKKRQARQALAAAEVARAQRSETTDVRELTGVQS